MPSQELFEAKAYLEPEIFQRMERSRMQKRRISRSHWVGDAILEKIERDEQPGQVASVKKRRS